MDSIIAPIQQSIEPVFRVEKVSGQGGPNHSCGYGAFAQDTFEVKEEVAYQLLAPTPGSVSRVGVPWWMPVWVVMEIVVIGGAVLFLLLLNGAL